MSMKARIGIGVLIAALAVALFFIFRPQKPTPLGVIRVGILKHESSLPMYIAEELGYFKNHGVEVQLVEPDPGVMTCGVNDDRVN